MPDITQQIPMLATRAGVQSSDTQDTTGDTPNG